MKNTVIHILIIVVAIIAGGMLAQNLNQKQHEISPSRARLTALPVGGFHKFMSDVQWMLFVNYLGTLNTVDEENVDEVVKRLERLIAYDPNLSKIYQEGVAMISIADPQKTVDILTEACNNQHLKNNSQIPFYAGFVMVQHMKPPKYQDAIPFFKMAIDRSGGSDQGNTYYTSYYYRAKAKVLSDGKLDDRFALLQVLYDEWKGANTGDRSDAPSAEYNSQDLKDRLLTAMRNAKNPSDDYKPTPEAIKLADEVASKVFSDNHLCPNCTASYAAGEEYCAQCGTKVKIYGLCPHCGKVMAPGARFCAATGKAIEAPKK